jgi:hypothetical protein
MLACAFAALGSNLARAEPPQRVLWTEDARSKFATRDQIIQVLTPSGRTKSSRNSDEFTKVAGPKNEPGRLYSDIGPILFGASERVGVLFDNDRAINLWVSHVGNRRGAFYPWEETGEETSV